MVLAVALLAGCARDYVMLAPRPPATYEKLGKVEGVGCGSAWLLFPFDDVVHAGFSGRIERARDEALSRHPGATALLDVEVHESAAWWILGITECVTVRGQAIR